MALNFVLIKLSYLPGSITEPQLVEHPPHGARDPYTTLNAVRTEFAYSPCDRVGFLHVLWFHPHPKDVWMFSLTGLYKSPLVCQQ